MPNKTIILSDTLYYNRENSDKVYEVELYSVNQYGRGACVVTRYGRRGSVLKEIKKCTNGTLNQARTIYLDLVVEKLNKGYRRVAPARDAAANFLDMARREVLPHTYVDDPPVVEKAPKAKAKPKAKPKALEEKVERNIAFDL